ncbi:MAG: hypothetical protein IAE79_04190 [Anaerolinea sp.]|nr:hypothetical protein [Anaerolinea sp.]
MTQLSLQLFGRLAVKRGKTPLPLPTRKAEAVFVYLVCQNRPVAREALVAMFWAGSGAGQAAANLRKLLSAMRQLLGEYLTIERQVVTLTNMASIWSDTAEFARLLAVWEQNPENREPLTAALSLYQGEFLADFHLPDSPDFNTWAALERERWQQMAVHALYELVDYALHTRQYAVGQQYARRLLALAPLQEAAHRQWLLLLFRSGQTAVALAHYQQYCQLLAQELGVAPSAEMAELAARLATAVTQPPALPTFPTPFVGRQPELARVQQQLADLSCRLLTLVGPGGIGKTRLALQAAQDRWADFLHGIYFISLAELPTAAAFMSSLAAALNSALDNAQPAAPQLLAALHHRELLLILDNGEALLTPATLSAAEFVVEMLQHAPQLTILVTSQERFNFPGECIVEIGGLPLPEGGGSSVGNAAVTLFRAGAMQVDPNFTLTPANLPIIAAICHLVDGLPLGIELAAAATAHYALAAIASGIAADVDFLSSEQADKPLRQRSLRAAFAYTWQRLLSGEQVTLQRLSGLGESFSLATAVTVTQATPQQLLALVDKSILRLLPDGRYQVYPLLRRFCKQQNKSRVPPEECGPSGDLFVKRET